MIKWSLNENLFFWKETFDEWNFYFPEKNKRRENRQLYCPINVTNNFLPSNRNEAKMYSALKTERVRMKFIVWRSI